MYVMVDLETLDTKESAVILSVGAVRFNNTEILEDMYTEVNINDQLRLGRTVDGKTLQWWMEQSPEARAVFESNDTAPRLASALAKLAGFVVPDCTIWGNGATFDISILRSAYQSLQTSAPWLWYNERCFRTLKTLFPDVQREAEPKVVHNGLGDARAQALHMQKILERCVIPS